MTTSNQIIGGTFRKATDLNKFRTFARIFRDTIEENFSSENMKCNFHGMSFEEWSGYYIGDKSWNAEDVTEFTRLAKRSGIYAEAPPDRLGY